MLIYKTPKVIFVLWMLICSHSILLGQQAINNPDIKRTWHWYFGYNAGLDFSSGNAVSDLNGQMNVAEGSIAMSDENGNLLFYSNGQQIWDKNNQIMPNGSNLISIICGTGSTAQLLAIPKPNSSNIYYLFSNQYATSSSCVESEWVYSIIDISLNNGLGDVVSFGNLLLGEPCTEKITAIKHSDENSIWIITAKKNTNCFYAFKLNSDSLTTIPITSCIGPENVSTFEFTLKASSDGKKLAASYFNNSLAIFDFDNSSGLVSNQVQLPNIGYNPADEYVYGIEFSPNNKYLYHTLNMLNPFMPPAPYIKASGIVYQVDLNGDSAYVAGSRTVIDSIYHIDSTSNNLSENFCGAIQLAPNGILYIAKLNKYKLAGISNPNDAGLSCNYSDSLINVSKSGLGLPCFPNYFFYDSSLVTNAFATTSFNATYSLHPNPNTGRFTLTQNQEGYIKTYSIIDITGRPLLTSPMGRDNTASTIEISLEDLPKGIYILQLETTEGMKAERVVYQ